MWKIGNFCIQYCCKSAQYDPTDSPQFLKTGELIHFGLMMAKKLELVSTKIEEVSTEIIIQCALQKVLSPISRCAEQKIHFSWEYQGYIFKMLTPTDAFTILQYISSSINDLELCVYQIELKNINSRNIRP